MSDEKEIATLTEELELCESAKLRYETRIRWLEQKIRQLQTANSHSQVSVATKKS